MLPLRPWLWQEAAPAGPALAEVSGQPPASRSPWPGSPPGASSVVTLQQAAFSGSLSFFFASPQEDRLGIL